MLFETLSRSEALWTIGDESHAIIEGIDRLNPKFGQVESNRLVQEHADPATAELIRERFEGQLRDRAGTSFNRDSGKTVRMLEKTPKNALRQPFLDRVFPDALYIYLFRRPEESISSIMEAWRSGRFRTYRQLDGWEGEWSMLLPPGYPEVRGSPLEEIAAFQWESANRHILDDLDSIAADRWTLISYADFLQDPAGQCERLCEFIDVPFDSDLKDRVSKPLPFSRYTVTAPDGEKWLHSEQAIERVMPSVMPVYKRILETAERFLQMSRHQDQISPANEPISESAMSRNRPCPCGSGKRYKHCHGALGQA